jgi:putative PIN family toxin of toxin-antitoxin system
MDSSVLIAAYISRAGMCAQLLEDIFMRHQLVTSEYIVNEVVRKLTEKFRFEPAAVSRVNESILTAAECIYPAALPTDSCRDPEDIPVLGTAVAGTAEIFITVDKNLLALQRFMEIPIVRPSEFWKLQAH